MVDPTSGVSGSSSTPPSSSEGSSGPKGSAKSGFGKDGSIMSTRVSSWEDVEKAAPELAKAMEEGMCWEMISKNMKDEDKRAQKKKEQEHDTYGT